MYLKPLQARDVFLFGDLIGLVRSTSAIRANYGVRIRTPSATYCHTIGETNTVYTTLCDNCKLRSESAIGEDALMTNKSL